MKTRFKGLFIPLILLGACSVYGPDLLKDSPSLAGSSGASLGSGGKGDGGTVATGGVSHAGSSGTVSQGGMMTSEGGINDTAGAGGEQSTDGDWLHVEGNKILHADGTPFLGRGIVIYDTRQCSGCAWTDPGPVLKGIFWRIDMAMDEWGGNLIRLNLSSFADDASGLRIQWKDVLNDPEYAADVVTLVKYIGSKSGHVLIGLHEHPSLTANGLPTADTLPVWKKISVMFKDLPYVMYAVADTPFGTMDDNAWTAMNNVVETIRSEETPDQRHLIAATGMQTQGDPLAFFRTKPLTAGDGKNIIYAVTVYAHADMFPSVFLNSAETLPVVVTGFGFVDDNTMTLDDSITLMQQAEAHRIPYMGSSFAVACGQPLMFVFQPGNVDCRSTPTLTPTAWGVAMKKQLATPWALPAD